MQALAAGLRRLFVGVGILYSVSIIMLAALWAIRSQNSVWLILSNVFAVFLFVPLLLLVPLALFVRSKVLRVTVLAALTIFLVLFGPRFIPPQPRPKQGLRLRIVTLNQLYKNQHAEAVIQVIRAQHADIVALQELSHSVAKAAQQQLRVEYPYQSLMPAWDDCGMGLLSRYPLQSVVHEQAANVQHGTIDVNGQQVTVMNVHLKAPDLEEHESERFLSLPLFRNYDGSQRAREMAHLVDLIDRASGPLIVLGDFNTGDREPLYNVMASRMHDAYREAGWGLGFSFPSNAHAGSASSPFPLIRIDYIWSRGGITPTEARVECNSGGSDHCMVVADVQLDLPTLAAQQPETRSAILRSAVSGSLKGGDRHGRR